MSRLERFHSVNDPISVWHDEKIQHNSKKQYMYRSTPQLGVYITILSLSLCVCATTVNIEIIPRETYPSFRHIPEGRWSVFNVTLPNQPYHNVTITFHTLTPTITLSLVDMTFDPTNWDIPQILTVFATEDDVNAAISPYVASFNMSLTSLDHNYDGAEIEDFDISIEDNDDGKYYRDICNYVHVILPTGIATIGAYT